MNPCPCGHQGDTGADCHCTPAQVRNYRARVSGPLLDRLDMHVAVPRLTAEEFGDGPRGEASAVLAERVARVRAVQLQRQGRCNARLADAQVQRWCALDARGGGLLDQAMQQRRLSARARQRILKLARTIADLDGRPDITAAHVGEAVMLRSMDREQSAAARV